MSNAEHLIESAILAMEKGENVEAKLNSKWFKPQIDSINKNGITAEDFYRMAQHIVYSMYDGVYPTIFGKE